MKVAIVALALLLMALPLAWPLAERVVAEYETRSAIAEQLTTMAAETLRLQRTLEAAEAANATLIRERQRCQLVVNDGRKFAWAKRADGWCYTEDLRR